MHIDEREIELLAKLSKLAFDEQKLRDFAGEFEEIINFADTINTSVSGDTQTIREIGGQEIPLDRLREDEVLESLPREKILSNVESENGYFHVKRVVK